MFSNTLDRLKPFLNAVTAINIKKVDIKVPDLDDIEDIELNAGIDDDIILKPRKVNYRFKQHKKFKGVQRAFVIFNESQLLHSYRTFNTKKKSKSRINLKYIDSSPEKVLNIAWAWLSTSLALIIWSMLLVYIGHYTDFRSDNLVTVGMLMGMFSILSFLAFYHFTEDKVVFRSFASRLPLIEVDSNTPSQQQANEFIDLLRNHIDLAQPYGFTLKERLAGEIKDLRRLRDDTVITEAEYLSARVKIFKHEAYLIHT